MNNPNYHPANVDMNTRIGGFVNLQAGATIGARVHIGPRCAVGVDTHITGPTIIESNVSIGDSCMLLGPLAIEEGVQIMDNIHIEASQEGHEQRLTIISRGAYISENVTLAQGITIGPRAFIEPGSKVIGDVPANAIFSGSPAVFAGFVPH